MKFMKSKVAAGVLAVSMVATMGTAYAAVNPNAGTQLQNWYTATANAAKALVTGNFNSYYNAETAKLNTSVNNTINTARENIRDTGRAEVTRLNNNVNGQLNTYLGQIDSTNSSIQGSMQAEYNSFVSGINAKTNSDLAVIGTASEKSIANAVKNHEGVYTTRLNEAATKTQSEAVAALQAKIAAVKAELNGLVEQGKANATNEINANLDSKISELKATLEALTAQLTAAAQGRIVAKSDQLQAEAIDALNAVVNGINN
ncbi:hypothetical protein [Paenibacillus gansuensis]|uniref:Uncharacterized protein n=1 Tax=Paenibacillus gansuensis TaxID=306542 RepID=A0ABW5PKZ1_9BACL